MRSRVHPDEGRGAGELPGQSFSDLARTVAVEVNVLDWPTGYGRPAGPLRSFDPGPAACANISLREGRSFCLPP